MVAPDKPCVLWDRTGPNTARGYGQVQCEDGKRRRVHRLVCEFFHGPAPFTKAEVLHSCDTPACYEPSHLRWGSHQENAADMAERLRSAIGERNGNATLTANDVEYALGELALGRTQGSIASQLGVTQQAISKIKTGKRWAHLRKPRAA